MNIQIYLKNLYSVYFKHGHNCLIQTLRYLHRYKGAIKELLSAFGIWPSLDLKIYKFSLNTKVDQE